MSIWFLLWLFLSGALLYFLGWTLFILFRQKQAWKNFAVKHKLRFKSPSALSPPEMGGMVENYSVSFFIGEHLARDARSSRKLSAIEIKLPNNMPFEGAVASGGMVPLVQSIQFREEIRPDHPKWDKNYIAAGSNRAALVAYLNPERLEAITSFMKIKNGWVIVIFRGENMLLRFDTPDALDTQDKLEKITKKMIDLARLFGLKPGEESMLKSELAKKPAKEANIDADHRDFKKASSFELEEEPVPEVKPEEKLE